MGKATQFDRDRVGIGVGVGVPELCFLCLNEWEQYLFELFIEANKRIGIANDTEALWTLNQLRTRQTNVYPLPLEVVSYR